MDGYDTAALVSLAWDIASMTKDGEDLGDGEYYEMENDDAVDTVNSLIGEARRILGAE